jgi:hexosaminidase
MTRHSLLISALLFLCSLVLSSCCADKASVVWIEGEADPQTRLATHTIIVRNAPEGTDWALWLSSNHIDYKPVEGSQGTIELFHGCYYKMTPAERDGKDLVVKYMDDALQRHCWAPEGFAIEQDGKMTALEVKYEFLPYENIPDFPYNQVETEVWDMIPSLKNVTPAAGTTVVAQMPEVEIVPSCKAGWYKIVLDGECKVQAADEDGAQYAKVTIENMKRNAGSDELPNLVIEDWPDFSYRGFMLDISRNFTNKENILKFIDLLAHYKVSVFHLHFGDDEGWRVEIPEFPELTTYGAYHEFPYKDENGNYTETNYLLPSYNGSFDPKDMTSSANGHLTKEDYVEIVKHAWERRITVIPEFDTPGHSRAAIKAMEAYAKRTGDDSFLLSDPEDASEYCSVQYYRDNALNVAMPSTYKFIEVVFDRLIAYHKEAGAPIPAIHVGGDEVPGGAWVGSEPCQKIMKERGWDNIELMKSYYIENVLDIAESRGVKISGWQELVMDLEDHVYERMKKNLYSVNFWHTGSGNDEYPYKYANDGVPTVLSNMTNTYVDFAYTPDKTERGLSWGGFVDERRSFSLLPFDIYRSVRWDDHGRIRDISKLPEGKTPLKAKENIIGVQAQLWTETVRNFDHVTSYVFPKVCGVFERAWNASPSWEGTTVADDPAFMAELDRYYSTVVSHEMPYYEAEGVAYRHRKN